MSKEGKDKTQAWIYSKDGVKTLHINTQEEIEQLHKACKYQSELAKMPDAFMKATAEGLKFGDKFLGPAFLGPAKPLLTTITLGYGAARKLGWDPTAAAIEDQTFCKMFENALKPSVEYGFPSTSDIELKQHQSAPIREATRSPPSSVVAKSFKEHSKELQISNEEQERIIEEAIERGLCKNQAQLEEKIDKAIRWQETKDKQENDARFFEEIHQAIGFVGQLGALTGCRELTQFATFAQAGVQIAQFIGQLASGFAMGPVVGIANAVLSIFSSFMSKGPDPTQIILNQISKLSDQLNDLKKEMGQYFQKNYEMQRQILEVVVKGFNQLSQQISKQIGELRVELRVEFQDIKAHLNFISQYTQLAHIENHLTDFKNVHSKVEQYLRGTYDADSVKTVTDGSAKLRSWVKEHSCNGLITGRVYFDAWKKDSDPKLLEDALKAATEEKLNYFLDFFVGYATEIMKMNKASKEITIRDSKGNTERRALLSIDNNSVPNPEVWFKAVQIYIELQQLFPQLDIKFDPDDDELEKMIESAQCGLDFFERIAQDNVFWDALFNQYNDCLKEVDKHANEWANYHSNEQRKTFNDAYNKINKDKDEIIRQKSLEEKEFDLLAKPQQLFVAFQTRNINKITEATSKDNIKLTKHQPWHYAVKQKNDLVSDRLLAAEYLQLIYFTANQHEAIPLPHIPTCIYGDDVSNLYDTICARDGAGPPPCQTENEYYIHDKAPVGREFFRNKGLEFDITVHLGRKKDKTLKYEKLAGQITHWQLPLTLQFVENRPDAKPYQLIKFNFTGKYTDDKIADAKILDYRKDSKNRKGPWTDKDNNGEFYPSKLKEGIPRHIEKCWNEVKHEEIQAHVIEIINDGVNLAHQSINEYYVEQRKVIALALKNREPRHASIVAYIQALAKLNSTVYLIRRYAYLCGKDLNDSFFQELINSDKIEDDLTIYAADKTLPDHWLDCITKARKNNFSYQTIENFPKAKQLPIPVALFRSGQLRLRFYQAWKGTYKKQFPTFSQYIDIREYMENRERTRNSLFQERVEGRLNQLFAQPFESARFALESIDSVAGIMSGDTYSESSRKILEWATENSTHPSATEYVGKDIDNLSKDKVQQITEMHLKPSGWACNIRSLMRYAENTTKNKKLFLDVRGKQLTAINFLFWVEGTRAYIDLVLFNPSPKIWRAAEEVKSDHHVKREALTRISRIGLQLKHIISTIAQSYELFRNLFEEYLFILSEPIEFIKLRLGADHQSLGELNSALATIPIKKDSPRRIDVYRLLATNIYQGACATILDRLTTYAVWIIAYLEMSFGYDVQIHQAQQGMCIVSFNHRKFVLYTDSETMLKFLKTNKDKLDVMLEMYFEQIKELRSTILLYITFNNDLICFHDVLSKLKEIPQHFKINKDWSLFPPIFEKYELLDQFLSQNKRITGLTFEGIPFDDHALGIFLQLLNKHPQITSVGLVNGSLVMSSLEILKNTLWHQSQLTHLDLSSNALAKENSIEHLWKLFGLLSDLLTIKRLPYLKHLNLSNNKFNNEGLCAMVATLKSSTDLISLDLSGNNFSPDEDFQEAIETLFKEHSYLKELLLFDMNLTPADLNSLDKNIVNKIKIVRVSHQPVQEEKYVSSYAQSVLPASKSLNLKYQSRIGQPLLNQTLEMLAYLEHELSQQSSSLIPGNSLLAQSQETATFFKSLIPTDKEKTSIVDHRQSQEDDHSLANRQEIIQIHREHKEQNEFSNNNFHS